jgi:hypothetical protein
MNFILSCFRTNSSAANLHETDLSLTLYRNNENFFVNYDAIVIANNIGSDIEQKDFTMNNKDRSIDPLGTPCFNAPQLDKNCELS